jgi:putative transposase
MARLARLVVPGQAHHLIQRGNNGQAIFFDDDDRRAYLAALQHAAASHAVAVHAYVMMDSEVQLLVTPVTAEGLSRTMQTLGRRYVAAFNRRHGRTGTLWEGRFRGTVIESERYLLSCMRFIETTPVRAGLAVHPADFGWSSYGHHAGQRVDSLLTDHALFWTLGNTPFDRQSAYKALMDQPLSGAEVQRLASSAFKGWGLGSPEFLERIAEHTRRRVVPRKRGRPGKASRATAPAA